MRKVKRSLKQRCVAGFYCYVLLGALLLLNISCSTPVTTKVNTFRVQDASLGEGSIAVVAADDIAKVSLEYAYYATSLEQALQSLGYTLVLSQDSPESTSTYIAFLNYAVSEVESRRNGSFSTGLYSTSRAHHSAAGTGVVIVDDSRRRPEFERKLQLVIALRGEQQERVYEVTGTSRGRCGTLSAVFEEMLEAMLTDFPANNGSLNTISVRGDSRC